MTFKRSVECENKIFLSFLLALPLSPSFCFSVRFDFFFLLNFPDLFFCLFFSSRFFFYYPLFFLSHHFPTTSCLCSFTCFFFFSAHFLLLLLSRVSSILLSSSQFDLTFSCRFFLFLLYTIIIIIQ